MSKERELLQKVVNHMWQGEIVDEIKELLAQPEQEQEPVAWIIETEVEGKLLEWVCTDKKHYMEEHDSIKKPISLYTAPPKREPLSEDKLDVLAEANITDEGIAGYYLGFRDAEKHHGIGGGE